LICIHNFFYDFLSFEKILLEEEIEKEEKEKRIKI